MTQAHLHTWFSKTLKLTLIASLILVGGIAPSAQAATDANSGQGLQISPVLTELNGERGGSYTIKLSVMNVTGSDLIFNSQVNDFGAKDETGTPEILLDQNAPASASIKAWVTPIRSLRLKPKQVQSIDVKINVPKDAEPGGHYGVVRFSGTPPELEDTGVSLAASAGTLILVRVSGAINEQLRAVELFATNNGQPGSWFESTPLTLVQRIKNEGNVHVKPVGTGVVTDMFGRKVASIQINPDNRNILPNSIRRFEESFNGSWLIGQYTMNMSLAYGTTGQVLEGQTTFWIIPWRLILAVIAILALLFFGLRWKLNRYKAKIIRKATGGNSSHKK